MKKTIIFLCLVVVSMTLAIKCNAGFWQRPPEPKDNEVIIFEAGVKVPANKILLIRKKATYSAVKFTSCWTEVDEERLKKHAEEIDQGGELADMFRYAATKKFAFYESFYQGDGSSDFTNQNVQVIKDKASWLPLKGSSRFFLTQPGNPYIKFGPHKLTWLYKAFVGFMPPDKIPGEFGFEIAPTPWTDIKEVNINDPRLEWFRYSKGREETIYELWTEDEKKETDKRSH